MGRVSKRKIALKNGESRMVNRHNNVKRYKAGIYVRLSSDHDSNKNESIDTQIELVKKFVENYNASIDKIDIVRCYTDLGKTGSNFEREGFKRLLADIRRGEINCVLVKDLSRFGRNYLETGNYIEKIFPFMGVRFIAVADDFDTAKDGNENKQIAFEIKNLINDMYTKDFSKKAKINLEQRRRDGAYTGGPPPYGYVAGWTGRKRVLMPDYKTADIVRFIYEKFVETESYTAVAALLSTKKVNPPTVYKRTGEVYYLTEVYEKTGEICHSTEMNKKTDEVYYSTEVNKKTGEIYHSQEVYKKTGEVYHSQKVYEKTSQAYYNPAQKEYKNWNKSAVERILKSETYYGILVQGKTSVTARNEKNRVRRPQNEWVITEAAHESLIDLELYQKAAAVRSKISRKRLS